MLVSLQNMISSISSSRKVPIAPSVIRFENFRLRFSSIQWGKTALMYATGKGDLELIQTLIKAGANVSTVDHVSLYHSEISLSLLINSSPGNLSSPMVLARDAMPRYQLSSLRFPSSIPQFRLKTSQAAEKRTQSVNSLRGSPIRRRQPSMKAHKATEYDPFVRSTNFDL
jgi:hypothetical protein